VVAERTSERSQDVGKKSSLTVEQKRDVVLMLLPAFAAASAE
jgi:hypothetical protein